MKIIFEWDENKNEINLSKHGVSFEEAKEIWADKLSLEFYDDFHSKDEERFIRVGHNIALKILFVVFCEKKEGEIVRIISARKATKKEIKDYEKRI